MKKSIKTHLKLSKYRTRKMMLAVIRANQISSQLHVRDALLEFFGFIRGYASAKMEQGPKRTREK